jgi:elongation factor 1-gamma
MVDILTGKVAKFETAEYNATLNKVKNEAIALNGALKGKKFLVGDKVTLADLVCAWTLMPAFQLVLDAGFRKGKAEVAAWFESVTSLPEFKKSAGNVKACAKALKPPGAAGDAPKAAPAKAKKEEDDMDDLFGSDDDDGAAAAAAKAVADKAKAGKKKEKKPVIA